MDYYFAKFRKRATPPKVQPTSSMQLAKFHKCWDYVHNIFIAEDRKANLHIKQTEIPEKLRTMVDLLVDEEARQEDQDTTTGVCMEYLLKHNLLNYLVNVCEKQDYPEGMRGETIRTIASMVDLLDDHRFLVHHAVHTPTIKLLRYCCSNSMATAASFTSTMDQLNNLSNTDLYHEDLVDLMYIICSKIHGFPALLNIFFHDKQWLTMPQKKQQNQPQQRYGPVQHGHRESNEEEEEEEEEEEQPEYEFLLFSYLLKFVHREGRLGDYARTGLLFIMEMATPSHPLTQFILQSDFAIIMAAGLGALYSQLPRKLQIFEDEKEHTSSYLLSQECLPKHYSITSDFGIEQQSCSEQFKYQLDSFLKLLEFYQDVLSRTSDIGISAKLLQSIRMIFLENILYPSILECSDADGSSVAVISYINVMLQSIQQQELADVIVGYLMNDPSTPDVTHSKKHKQQHSHPYINMQAERFTLKDLIFSRLKSKSQPTVIVTLRLLRTVLLKHCKFAEQLLTVDDLYPSKPESAFGTASISHHQKEVELYFALISAIDRFSPMKKYDWLSLGYEDYIKDIESMMDSDPCFQDLMEHSPHPYPYATKGTTGLLSKSERRRSFKYGQQQKNKSQEYDMYRSCSSSSTTRNNNQQQQQQRQQRLSSRDPLLHLLQDILSHFFAQSSELNLALTGVLSALAICPYRSLEGWLTFSENDRTHPNDTLNLSSPSDNTPSARTVATAVKSKKSAILVLDNVLDSMQQPSRQPYYYSQRPFRHRRRSSVLPTATHKQGEEGGKDEEEDLDDDKSIDFAAELHSFEMTYPTQFKSFPPFYTLFRTLTQQIDYYRSEIGDQQFDQFLEERRQGLLFGEVTESIDPPSLSHSSSSHHNSKRTSSRLFGFMSSSLPSPVPTPRKRRNSTASLMSTLTFTDTYQQLSASQATLPTTMTTTTTTTTTTLSSTPSSASAAAGSATAQAPQLAVYPSIDLHIKKTLPIRVQPLFPSHYYDIQPDPVLNLDEEDEDVFAPITHYKKKGLEKKLSLSMILNNVVILEECIKEVIAIIQVRRSLGIDTIKYTSFNMSGGGSD
ncbi:Retinoic acid induced 16-like protein-domain-containing protein [Mycotypha africana]|uniref:Retinoic acid induced 16-like protein-domain-containing protein n=1 Tax=Mycotypha africana TaxID=64632 RepID=UPI0023001F36|nr:Retinoic acid induced 16-like protein-domain-containing protein [Mycotypha africana]KAI8967723.1 Retinoic acid induced 16-like protein-domain-containing protein [Mycotypha africana]